MSARRLGKTLTLNMDGVNVSLKFHPNLPKPFAGLWPLNLSALKKFTCLVSEREIVNIFLPIFLTHV